jgi:hypothetical protein
MSTFTVRCRQTGALYGHHLSPTEAAAVILRHTTRRFAINRMDDDYYELRVQIPSGIMSVAYSNGRVIGAHALTKEAAWQVIALQIIEAEWPGIGIWPDDKPSLRVVYDKHHRAKRLRPINTHVGGRLKRPRKPSAIASDDDC